MWTGEKQVAEIVPQAITSKAVLSASSDPLPVYELASPEGVVLRCCRVDEIDAALLLQPEQLGILSPDELTRFHRFCFDKDRCLFAAARLLLRCGLSSHARVPPVAWRFRENAYGRPEIAAPCEWSHLRFNVSHSGQVAVCAVSCSGEVGVDVEWMDRHGSLLEVAAWAFSERELQRFEAAPFGKEKRAEFFRIWTLKEAYAKARGIGLSLPLSEVEFRHEADGMISANFSDRVGDDPASWRFDHFRIFGDYMGALAFQTIRPSTR